MATLYRRKAFTSFLLNAHKIAAMLVGIPLFLGVWYVGTHQSLFETHGGLLTILFGAGFVLFASFQFAWELARWRFKKLQRARSTFRSREWYVVRFSDLWLVEDLLLKGSEIRRLGHSEDVVFVEEYEQSRQEHRDAHGRRLVDAWGTTPRTRKVVREIKALQRLGEETE